MAFALVQTASNNGTGAVDANLSPVGASGRVIRVAVFWHANAPLDQLVTKIAGTTQGDVATAVGTRQFYASGGIAGFSFQEFVFLTPTAGVDKVTAVSAGNEVDVMVQEHSGFTTTPTIKIPASPYASTVTSNSSVSGSVTTDIANAIVCSSCFPSGGASSASDGTGWTTDSGSGDANWGGGGYGHRYVSATGTYGPVTWVTTSGTSGDANSIYAIEDGTGGATTNPKTLTATETQTATVARQDGKPLSATQAEVATVKRVVSKVLIP